MGAGNRPTRLPSVITPDQEEEEEEEEAKGSAGNNVC